jgi:alpha-D-xyloside xylohydrolase
VSWQYARIEGGHRYTSSGGSVAIFEKPWRIELRDAAGKLLTRTQGPADFDSTLSPALPFSFIRRASDHSRSVAAVFSLSAGEKLFGGGESFTRLDKRGQKLVSSQVPRRGRPAWSRYRTGNSSSSRWRGAGRSSCSSMRRSPGR